MKQLPKLAIIPIFCSLLLSLNACKPTFDRMNLQEISIVASMEKGPCYGRCPVFNLTIYENGIVTFEGKRFTDREGMYYRKLNKKEISALREKFREADFFSFNRVYPSRIPDMATVSISYNEGDKSATVMGKEGRPEAVMKLENYLDKIANSGEWEARIRTEKEEVINEIIVQLKEEINLPTWMEKYRELEVDPFRKLTPNANNWLIRFNTEKISAEEMLKLLRLDEDVISAELNLNLETR